MAGVIVERGVVLVEKRRDARALLRGIKRRGRDVRQSARGRCRYSRARDRHRETAPARCRPGSRDRAACIRREWRHNAARETAPRGSVPSCARPRAAAAETGRRAVSAPTRKQLAPIGAMPPAKTSTTARATSRSGVSGRTSVPSPASNPAANQGLQSRCEHVRPDDHGSSQSRHSNVRSVPAVRKVASTSGRGTAA